MKTYPYLNTITGTVHATLKEAMQDILQDIADGYIKPEEIPDADIRKIITKENPRKYVRQVCRFLYEYTGSYIFLDGPKYVDEVKDGYSCKWEYGGYFINMFKTKEEAEEVVREINRAFYIHCYITPVGRLVIPKA